MTDRLHNLARQAWLRIQNLGHDPIESIHKALVYASTDSPLPKWCDTLYGSQRAVVMTLLPGPLPLRTIAESLGVNRRAACWRLRRLCSRGIVCKTRHGEYQLREHEEIEKRLHADRARCLAGEKP